MRGLYRMSAMRRIDATAIVLLALCLACLFARLSVVPAMSLDEAWIGLFAARLRSVGFYTPHEMNHYTGPLYARLAALVFAELLRSFGGRSETKPIWRLSLFSNFNLALVVAASFGLQVWSHHNATLARWLKTAVVSATDCLMLLAVSAIPLVVLELVKALKIRRAAQATRKHNGG